MSANQMLIAFSLLFLLEIKGTSQDIALVPQFSIQDYPVKLMTISDESEFIITVDMANNITIWGMDQLKQLAHFSVDHGINSVAILDGRVYFSANEKERYFKFSHLNDQLNFVELSSLKMNSVLMDSTKTGLRSEINAARIEFVYNTSSLHDWDFNATNRRRVKSFYQSHGLGDWRFKIPNSSTDRFVQTQYSELHQLSFALASDGLIYVKKKNSIKKVIRERQKIELMTVSPSGEFLVAIGENVMRVYRIPDLAIVKESSSDIGLIEGIHFDSIENRIILFGPLQYYVLDFQKGLNELAVYTSGGERIIDVQPNYGGELALTQSFLGKRDEFGVITRTHLKRKPIGFLSSRDQDFIKLKERFVERIFDFYFRKNTERVAMVMPKQEKRPISYSRLQTSLVDSVRNIATDREKDELLMLGSYLSEELNIYRGDIGWQAYSAKNQLRYIDATAIGKNLVACIKSNSEIQIYRKGLEEPVLSFYITTSGDLIYTDSPYYTGSKYALKNIVVLDGNKKIDPIEADIIYNRGDLVFKNVLDSSLLAIYEDAAEKRKLLFAGHVKQVEHLVLGKKVEIQNKSNLNYYTDLDSLLLTLHTLVGVDQVIILINGRKVAVQDMQSEVEVELTVLLSTGVNTIEVRPMIKGVKAGNSDWLEVVCAEKHRSSLYFVGLGVSNYKEANRFLKYASKDVLDVEKFAKNHVEG